ncbi:MAG TPA: nuclease-related domain-containing protein [Leptolyngbya sp.]|jgi:hypothetical protein|nr:nuclease-related domain-containing protein [Leptolyngbya sp.]
MSKSSRKAGQNIRNLAAKRRIKAIVSFVSASFFIFLPFFLVKTAEIFLKQIAPYHPHPSASLSAIFFVLSIVFILTALQLIFNGIYLWKRADQADQGAKGEEEMAQEMLQLEQSGWQVEYGMQLGNRLGDADIICLSPQNKAYVIDVKSHRGEVTTDGEQLHRHMGKAAYPFEKNFLVQAMKQALQVKKQKSLSFVTPIVVFSNAKVSIPSRRLKKVYVVEKSELISLLKSLG